MAGFRWQEGGVLDDNILNDFLFSWFFLGAKATRKLGQENSGTKKKSQLTTILTYYTSKNTFNHPKHKEISHVVSVKKEKPAPTESSAPAAPQQSESKELPSVLPPNRPPSPQGTKTPRQEAEEGACSTKEKPHAHTATLTPKPEVCTLY